MILVDVFSIKAFIILLFYSQPMSRDLQAFLYDGQILIESHPVWQGRGIWISVWTPSYGEDFPMIRQSFEVF